MITMRKLFIFFVFCSLAISAQVGKPEFAKKVVRSASDFGVTEPLRDVVVKPNPKRKKHHVVPNKLRRYKYINADALPEREDPVLQKSKLRSPAISPTNSWDGIDNTSQGVSPPDPSGAAGKNHYVQMVNVAMEVFDKQGNSLLGPTSLSSVFPGSANDGDPIVMYDKYADRWFISQFQTANNKILIAISTTPDPTGSWYHYSFSFDDFPDYPKYSIWNNGYYMTANMGSENAVCFERDKMLAGDPSARMVALTVPDVESNGFFSASPAHADGDQLPALDVPAYLFYFQDDGWAAGSDRIKIWEMNVDWADPNSASIQLTQELAVAPFNTDFDDNWNDLAQPGTGQKLDAVPGAFMYMGQFKNFKSHNSMLLSHTVDVDLTSNKLAAVRWYELRQGSDQSWSVYQEGTFGPNDGESRWMGCVAMDRQGNIGLAYSKTSSSTFPSIHFTGRKKDDLKGEMTVNESSAFIGSGSQTGLNRFGDYAQMTLDPIDGLTFWYTGEYIGSSGWKTGIFSFQIGELYSNDVSVSELLKPLDGDLGLSEKVKVVLKNLGSGSVSNFPISFKVNGSLVTETYTGTILSGDTAHYQFSVGFDFSTPGNYTVISYSDLVTDEDRNNDSLCVQVMSSYSDDVGVSQILEPVSGVGLNAEVVKVRLKNFGTNTVSNFPVSYFVDGSTVTENYTGTLLVGGYADFTFVQTVDLSTAKKYQVVAYTSSVGDNNAINDTSKFLVENKNCNPTSDCSFGDGFTRFELNTINNSSVCSGNGYNDFTSVSTVLALGQTYSIFVESAENDQVTTIWIDYNDNFVFESNEMIVQNETFNTAGKFTFTVPANANPGEHILRARTNWMSNSDDPCMDYDYGETEDYKVHIGPDNAIEVEVASFELKLITSQNQLKVIGLNNEQGEVELSLFNSLGQLLAPKEVFNSSSFEKEFSLAEMSSGIYYVRVQGGKSTFVDQFIVK